MNRYTVDDIKRETARAFKPLRCEVRDFEYDSGFEFSVFDAEDPALVYRGRLRTSQYQDPKALAEVFRRWRLAVAAKGHELSSWTAPSANADGTPLDNSSLEEDARLQAAIDGWYNVNKS